MVHSFPVGQTEIATTNVNLINVTIKESKPKLRSEEYKLQVSVRWSSLF